MYSLKTWQKENAMLASYVTQVFWRPESKGVDVAALMAFSDKLDSAKSQKLAQVYHHNI